MPLLEVTALRTHFATDGGTARAVDGVSFSVEEGETVGIVGESGCGKTVTALSIMRLVPEPPGRVLPGASIRLRDRELLELPDRAMREVRGREVAMVFQEPMTSLNPVLTVGDQIREALILDGRLDGRRARRAAVRLLGEVGIPDPETRYAEYPHQLSGGMRQRIMIAIALALEPGLLIADEPTTALDVTIQAQILDLIAKLRERRRMGVLLITHDLGVVAEVADRVLVMYAGQIVESGTVREIFLNPRHPYTRGLLASLPRLEVTRRRLSPIPGYVPDAAAWPDGCRFRPRCPHAWEKCGEPPPASLRDGREGGRTVRCWLVDEPGRRGVAARTAAAAPAPDGKPAEAEEPPLLRVRGLRKYFPVRSRRRGDRAVVRAVDGVSFEIRRGETLGLVGESGCGKSTAARAILRLIEPTGGAISFRGDDVRSMKGDALRRLRRRAQIIFQDPFGSLNPRMTVEDMLGEILKVHGLAAERSTRRRRILELLDLVGLLPGHADRYPHEFSGGQRQRIGIARALSVEPELIICDEPVSALDVSVQAQVLNLLRDLQGELGLTYLFISHDLGVVRHVSDRVAVMYLGRIVETASVTRLYRHARHPYTRSLLSAIPRPEPRGAGRAERILLEGDIPSPAAPPPGCHFHPRCWHPGRDQACTTGIPPLEPAGRRGHHAACIKLGGESGA